jgi:hypothetical protein
MELKRSLAMKTIVSKIVKVILLSLFLLAITSSSSHAETPKPPQSHIAFFNEMIYMGNGESFLHATNVRTGQEVWKKFSSTDHLTAKVKNLKA